MNLAALFGLLFLIAVIYLAYRASSYSHPDDCACDDCTFNFDEPEDMDEYDEDDTDWPL